MTALTGIGISDGFLPISGYVVFRALLLTASVALGACSTLGQTDEAQIRGMLQDKGVTAFAAGDIAECKGFRPEDSKAARTAALIDAGLAGNDDAVVLTLGDHTYPVGLPAEFADCYQPTWGRFKSRTYPTPGNHEYYTAGAPGYYGYFGEAAGPDQRGYYSFNLGNWHVVSLNSMLKAEQQQAQLAWLRKDLADHPAHCTLAYWHHPLYSSGGHGSSARMQDAWRILHAAGAELVLASHDHDYERFAPQDAEGNRDATTGIRQFVVGTGGATLTPLLFRKFHSEASSNTSFGVLKLQLKSFGYEWEFLPAEKDGFSDRGAAFCH